MKKIRNLVLIVLCILTVALFAGCSSTPAAAEKTKFIVGLDDSFPPMGFRDDSNNIVGFDVDLATEVANRLGMEVELKPIDWDAKVLELNSGSVDVLWNGVSITEERKQEMDFSRPYLANQQVIIVKVDSDIADIASLAGKIVGLQKGSSALDALNKNEIASQVASVQEYADNVTALTDLSIGRLSFCLFRLPSARQSLPLPCARRGLRRRRPPRRLCPSAAHARAFPPAAAQCARRAAGAPAPAPRRFRLPR